MEARGDALDDGNVPFSALVAFYESISDPLKSSADKTRSLSHFLRPYIATRSPQLLYAVVRNVIPQVDRARGAYSVKESALARIYADVFNLPAAAADQLRFYKDPARLTGLRARAGDFSSVAFNVLRDRIAPANAPLSLRELNAFLDALQKALDNPQRKAAFDAVADRLGPREHKWLIRIILKDLKLGVGHERILRLLHPEGVEIFNSCTDLAAALEKIVETAPAAASEEEAPAPASGKRGRDAAAGGVTLFVPFKPMLAKRVEEHELAGVLREWGAARPAAGAAEGESASRAAAAPATLILEPKYDGERIICHIDRGANRVEFYTRKSHTYTSFYGPSLTPLILKNFQGDRGILDGEVLGWDYGSSQFVPFGANRSVARGEVEGAVLCFVVFDVLLFAGGGAAPLSLLRHPLADRRAFLARVLRETPPQLMVTAWRAVRRVEDCRKELDLVVKHKREGLMLKSPHSAYHLNSRNGGWFKLKPALGALSDTLDLLVIGGYFGESGRRDESFGGMLAQVSTFLCAVLETPLADDPAQQKVRSLCKVGTGYSLSELREMREYLRPTARRYTGPPSAPYLDASFRFAPADRPAVVVRDPGCGFVMEVQAAELTESAAFDAGWTLRFPRAVRGMRRDKDWRDAMTDAELRELVVATRPSAGRMLSVKATDDAGPHVKLEPGAAAAAAAAAADSEEEEERRPAPRVARKKQRRVLSPGGETAAPERLSEIFLGVKVHVVAADYAGAGGGAGGGVGAALTGGGLAGGGCNAVPFFASRETFVNLVLANGGEMTNAPAEATYIVAPRPSFRTREMHRMYPGIPVVHPLFLLDCVEREQLQDLKPVHLVHSTPDLDACTSYDALGDSYFDEISPEDLRRILALQRHRGAAAASPEGGETGEGEAAEAASAASGASPRTPASSNASAPGFEFAAAAEVTPPRSSGSGGSRGSGGHGRRGRPTSPPPAGSPASPDSANSRRALVSALRETASAAHPALPLFDAHVALAPGSVHIAPTRRETAVSGFAEALRTAGSLERPALVHLAQALSLQQRLPALERDAHSIVASILRLQGARVTGSSGDDSEAASAVIDDVGDVGGPGVAGAAAGAADAARAPHRVTTSDPGLSALFRFVPPPAAVARGRLPAAGPPEPFAGRFLRVEALLGLGETAGAEAAAPDSPGDGDCWAAGGGVKIPLFFEGDEEGEGGGKAEAMAAAG